MAIRALWSRFGGPGSKGGGAEGVVVAAFSWPKLFWGIVFWKWTTSRSLARPVYILWGSFPDDCRCLTFCRLSLTFGKDQLPQRLVSNFFTPSEAKHNLVLRREKLTWRTSSQRTVVWWSNMKQPASFCVGCLDFWILELSINLSRCMSSFSS